MDQNERQKAIEEQKQKYYQECTDDIYLLYQSFRRSGFDPDQAFELTTTYVRQTVFDNAMRAKVYNGQKYKTLTNKQREILRKYNERNQK